MEKFNWNYPTSMQVGENRIKDLSLACKNLNIKKPLLVTDKGLGQSTIVKNNTLITPPLSSSALDGITRKSILEFAKIIKIKTKIREISKDELKKSDEVFLTGTAAEITPVIKIETKKIGEGKVGEVTKQVMDTYTQIVMNNNKKFSKWLTNVY